MRRDRGQVPTRALPRRGFAAVLDDRVARRLLAVQAVTELGDFVGLSALVLLTYRQTGSVLGPAGVLAARTLPSLCVGTVMSGWLDRPERRRALIGLALVGGLLVSIAAVHPTLIAALGVAALLGASRTAYVGIGAGIIVQCIDSERRGPFYALTNTINQSAQALGFLGGASATLLLGARASLGFDAVTFAVAAVLLAGLPKVAPAPSARRAKAGDGLRILLGDRTLRMLTPAVWASVLGLVLPETIVARVVHGAALPFVMAAAPVGMMLGAVTIGRGDALDRLRTQLRLAVLCGTAFLGGAAVVAAGGPAWAIGMANLSVGVFGVWLVGARTTFSRLTPPGRMAQVEAAMVCSNVMVEGVGVLVLGALVTVAGPASGYAAAALLILVTSLPRLVRFGGPSARSWPTPSIGDALARAVGARPPDGEADAPGFVDAVVDSLA